MLENSRRFLSLSALFSVILCATAAHEKIAVAAVVEVIRDTNARNVVELSVNRNNEVATAFSTNSAFGPFDVLEYSNGQFFDFPNIGARLTEVHLSNWGVGILNDENSSTHVMSGAIGVKPQEISVPAPRGAGAIAINDAGQLYFGVKFNSSLGPREHHIVSPSGPPQILPSLNEDSIYPNSLIDPFGNVVVRAQYNTNPAFSQNVYSYNSATGWTDISTGNLPPSTTLAFSSAVISNIGADGDFAEPGRFIDSGGKTHWEVLLYRKSAGKFVSVFDQTSIFTDFFGTPVVDPAYVQVGDQGQAWITVLKQNSSFEYDLSSIYVNPNGTNVDIASLLPVGLKLRVGPHPMNYNGDLWIQATNSAGLYTYFLYADGKLTPVVSNTTIDTEGGVLTNSRDVYFWKPDGDLFDLACIHAVPEPPSYIVAAMAIGAVSMLRKRNQY